MKTMLEIQHEYDTTIDFNQAYWRRTISDRIGEQIDQHYQDYADDGYRSHLGWSVLGHSCLRYLYYHWHWFKREQHHSRMERIFIDGHKIEAEIRHIMKARGAIFHDDVDNTGAQIRIAQTGGHAGGSVDGVFTWPALGITEKTLLECKSSNSASFAAVAREGVMAAKAQHYAQQSGYGYKLGIQYACYIMKNKNTSELHIEIIELDFSIAADLEKRAEFIILSNQPPDRISKKRNYYVCNMCNYQSVCHDRETPVPNCRNCKHLIPDQDATFTCARWGATVPNKAALIAGCAEHTSLPW